MKKLLALVLAVIMVMSLMAACGNTDNTGTTGSTGTTGTQGSQGSTGTTAGKEFSYPMDTDVTLVEWRAQNGNIKNHYGSIGNFDALPLAKWLEEETGIKVEYYDDYSDQNIDLERMWSTGDYTDIINLNWNKNFAGGATGALEDGVIIALNDVIDKWMPNFKAWMEANPEMAKECMTDDGIIYMIPNVNSRNDAMTYPMYYRADILAEMGEKEPTTVQGWYELFKKVKAQYPEMTPVSLDMNGVLRYGAFAHAYDFGFNSTQNGFAVKDGEIYYQRNQDLSRAFFEEMAKWVKEGLLDADWTTKKSADINKAMIAGKVFFSGGWLTGAMQTIQVSGSAQIPGFQLKAIGAPSVNGEQPTRIYASANIGGDGAAITTKCENVEVAARLLDYRWSEKGLMLVNYGKEGVSYDMVDGVPTFKAEILDETNENFPAGEIPEGDTAPWTTSQSLCRYSMGVFPCGMLKLDDYYMQLLTQECASDAVIIQRESVQDKCWDNQLPLLTYEYDEGKAVSVAATNLKGTTDQWATQFINGTKELNDDNWKAYLDAIEKAGLNGALIAVRYAYARWAER